MASELFLFLQLIVLLLILAFTFQSKLLSARDNSHDGLSSTSVSVSSVQSLSHVQLFATP